MWNNGASKSVVVVNVWKTPMIFNKRSNNIETGNEK